MSEIDTTIAPDIQISSQLEVNEYHEEEVDNFAITRLVNQATQQAEPGDIWHVLSILLTNKQVNHNAKSTAYIFWFLNSKTINVIG